MAPFRGIALMQIIYSATHYTVYKSTSITMQISNYNFSAYFFYQLAN